MADAKYLPEDIVQQIFLRMPTKPLLRLKCLSKHWNHIISDPNFLKSRLRRMIFLHDTSNFHIIDNTFSGSCDMNPSLINLCSPFSEKRYYDNVTTVGSFNGILLIVVSYQRNRDMILYNPLSGESKRVPDPSTSRSHFKYVYGFGYGDDLKIVRIEHSSFSSYYEVFDFETWSWSKPIGLSMYYCFYNGYSGVFVNGFLYWNATKVTGLQRRGMILAFDIKMMVFSEIEIPDGFWLWRILGTYKGQLCMIWSCNGNVDTFELHVLNKHGALNSWLIICSFTPPLASPIVYAFGGLTLCILDDGKLCILTDGKVGTFPKKRLIIYDMFKDSYVEVNGLASFGQLKMLQCIEYVESLISPSDICSVCI